MNYPRLALAALAAAVFDMAYGFVVYGNLAAPQFARYPAVYRAANDMSHAPQLMSGVVVGALAAAYIYAKGYEHGSGIAEGARFGVAIGAFVGGYTGLVSWAVLNIGSDLGVRLIVIGFVEWFLVGVIIGLIYRPGDAGGKRTVGV
jgi:hypothetical protein